MASASAISASATTARLPRASASASCWRRYSSSTESMKVSGEVRSSTGASTSSVSAWRIGQRGANGGFTADQRRPQLGVAQLVDAGADQQLAQRAARIQRQAPGVAQASSATSACGASMGSSCQLMASLLGEPNQRDAGATDLAVATTPLRKLLLAGDHVAEARAQRQVADDTAKTLRRLALRQGLGDAQPRLCIEQVVQGAAQG
ncbi:hypothetical protein G6F62_013477 [Rhizopus arrhizus]|nr:hypothetical protein G6F62_013477 [Rhizopus arrhizus]